MAFHNLCLNAKTLPGTEVLLGLGLEYCIKSPRPYQRLASSIRQIQCSARLHYVFKDQDEDLWKRKPESNTSLPSSVHPTGSRHQCQTMQKMPQKELEQETISEKTAMYLVINSLPCILHLENRVGLKILTRLLRIGLRRANAGLIEGIGSNQKDWIENLHGNLGKRGLSSALDLSI
jgi:hypothetical protein